MYVPPAFREDDIAAILATIDEARLSHLVTATEQGLVATPLPMFLVRDEGPQGTLYGHVARANPQWKLAPTGEAMALFLGPHAYITPNWYAAKQETHRVVPTWNYVAVHAYGPVEFFEDADRLRDIVTRLTNLHERDSATPWSVNDAPEQFVAAQLRAIVGLKLPITRIEGKRKMSQNRSAEDRAGVVAGLSDSERASDREVAKLIPE
jgi:transcriptional regulator